MNILGYQYTLRFDRDRDDLEAWGLVNNRTMEIHIATNLPGPQVTSTLLHEVIEAIKFHLAIKIEHDDINRLETALYQVLTENGVNLAPLEIELHIQKENPGAIYRIEKGEP